MKSFVQTLHDWHADLKKLAQEKEVEWVVSDDPEDHRDGWEGGDTPAEELDNQLSCCDWEN